MRDFLKDCLKEENDFVELRYHKKESLSISAEKGRIEKSSLKKRLGIGIRVLSDGAWGFSSTSEIDRESVKKAIEIAKKTANASAKVRREKIISLPKANFATGNFVLSGIDEIKNHTLDEKIHLILQTAEKTQKISPKIQSIACGYSEVFEEKSIVTTDGADVFTSLVRPEFRINAVASKDGQLQTGSESIGVTGGWDCLFKEKRPEELGEIASKTAIDLLDCEIPHSGEFTVILSPSIVGLLVHEAIGHTVEADFVLAGSVASGKIGTRVGSDLITLCDSGASEYVDGAGGTIQVDDEGILSQKTIIIQNGILRSYLHNRETAAKFGVLPTGSARAWEYSDVPLIRMRNTYLEPGDSTLQEMIAETKEGYFLEGPKNGQADSTGEFMFGVQKAYKIENGKITRLQKGVTVSGIAFDVLSKTDRVSKEFKWDLGSGYCGKGQPAKVDAGGPYIRTKLKLGGTVNE